MTEQRWHGKIDISNEDYHGGPGISKSHLDVISPQNNGCPAKYWYTYISEQAEPREPSPDMIIGTAVHTLVLEPETFDDCYVESQKFDRRTKAGKAEAAAFEEANKGRIVLEPDAMKQVKEMAHAVHVHPVASKLLARGEAETSFYATDPETGLLIKSRPDFINHNNFMIDLKTTGDASPDAFFKSIINFRYFIQPPWYTDVIGLAGHDRPEQVIFVAVEKKPPYLVGVYFTPPEVFDIGRMQARRDLNLINESLKNGYFPDYGYTAQPIALPAWFTRRYTV